MQRCWAKHRVHKIVPSHGKTRSLTWNTIAVYANSVHAIQNYQKRLWLKLSINNISKTLDYNGIANWVFSLGIHRH